MTSKIRNLLINKSGNDNTSAVETMVGQPTNTKNHHNQNHGFDTSPFLQDNGLISLRLCVAWRLVSPEFDTHPGVDIAQDGEWTDVLANHKRDHVGIKHG